MHTVGRHALRVPDGTDGPPNVPLWMDRLATDLSDVAKDNQGTLTARPTSTALTPGIAGRYFATTDELDTGAARRRLYRDAGQAWDELATLPLSRRMLGADVLRELPATTATNALGLLTVAQFNALPAQPDGTVVRVQLIEGVNVRLRLNKQSASAHKWEADGDSPFLMSDVVAAQTNTAAANVAFGGNPTIALPALAGDYEGDFGAGLLAPAATNVALTLLAAGVTTGNACSIVAVNGTGYNSVARSFLIVNVAASTALALVMSAGSAASTSSWQQRFLRVRPKRVTGPAAL